MLWDEEERRPTPRKTLKKMVYERDKGRCRVCGTKVDPFNFEIDTISSKIHDLTEVWISFISLMLRLSAIIFAAKQ